MEEKIFTEKPYPIPASNEDIKLLLGEIPKKPGVYRFLDEHGYPLYIGKAKSLKNRLSSYFRVSSQTKKLKKLLEKARCIDISLTNTELESLLHEQFLIKEFKPKFNVQFKDDKGYPWIKIETNKKFPSARSFLGKVQNEGSFFGPFPNGYAVRDALKLVQKTFMLRNCSDAYFKNRTRPCLQYEIGRCSAPCVNLISRKDYLKEVDGAQLLLQGRSEDLIKGFYKEMDRCSSEQSYERAAIYRDRISALRDIQRSQSVAGFIKSKDAIFISPLRGKLRIGITSVNGGWVTGHQNFYKIDTNDSEEILESFISQRYLSQSKCPQEILVGKEISNKKLIEKALSAQHDKKVSIVTKLGKKDKGLMELCRVNTEYVLRREKQNENYSLRLKKLGESLKISSSIEWIESFDISHHSGKNAVAGCVVYSSNGKEKKHYRSYNISEENAGNDIGSMIEVIQRRFSKKSINSIPDLIIIDGGNTHLDHVQKKLKELKFPNINVIAISKGVRRKADFDNIHLMNGKKLKVDETSDSFNFIQEMRDETHRYAITIQKNKARKATISTSLDNLTGIGKEKRRKLLRYFGSLEQLKRASISDLMDVSGIGQKTAESIFEELNN